MFALEAGPSCAYKPAPLRCLKSFGRLSIPPFIRYSQTRGSSRQEMTCLEVQEAGKRFWLSHGTRLSHVCVARSPTSVRQSQTHRFSSSSIRCRVIGRKNRSRHANGLVSALQQKDPKSGRTITRPEKGSALDSRRHSSSNGLGCGRMATTNCLETVKEEVPSAM